MADSKYVFGCLIKVENLWCLEEYGIKNTCILESLIGFPGYYGNTPTSSKPLHVYILTGKAYHMEDIVRITKQVKSTYPNDFDAAYTRISMGQESCGAVRIAGIKTYGEVRSLQECYRDMGLVLKKKVRDIENSEALIKIYKFFSLSKLAPGHYMDDKNTDIGFFEVKEDLDWDLFASRISILRNNIIGKQFDAAKCFMYKNPGITDMIRIYSKGLDKEFLEEISTKYKLLFD